MCFIEDFPLRMRLLKISCLHEVKTLSGLYGGVVARTVASKPQVRGLNSQSGRSFCVEFSYFVS